MKKLFAAFPLILLLVGCSSPSHKQSEVAQTPGSGQVDDAETRIAYERLANAAPGAMIEVAIQGRTAVLVRVEQHYRSASGKACVSVLEQFSLTRHAICRSAVGLHNRTTLKRSIDTRQIR